MDARVFFSLTGLAVASGPLVGGAITEGIAWQWIFWLNVPLGLTLVPLALARVPESFDSALDIRGLALVTGGVLGLVWGLVRGNLAGWGSFEVVATLDAGALLLGAFVAWELQARDPMLPLGFFRSRAFSAGNAAIFFTVGSLFSGVYFLAQFMQTGLGHGPLDAGLRLLPWTATLFFVAPIAGALVDRYGERPFLFAGPLVQRRLRGRDGRRGRPVAARRALRRRAAGPPDDIRRRRGDREAGAPVGRRELSMPSPRRSIVRYTVKPSHAEQNEALVRAVYRELEQTQPAGLRYATFKLDDGLTFVHVASLETDDGHNPLTELSAFREFQANIRERCAEGPAVSQIEAIGSFGWLGDRAAPPPTRERTS